MAIDVKICGIQDEAALAAAAHGGAAFVGFVFCPSSRRIAPAHAAQLLAAVPSSARPVGLFVDPTDDDLDQTVPHAPLSLLQLHGHETPARTAAIRARYQLPVIKVFHLADENDLGAIETYTDVADYFLFDTKIGATPTGGTGRPFNWRLLSRRTFSRPWFLAGGIDPQNLREAVATTGARMVDLSSGVETDGKKDAGKIQTLLSIAQTL